MAQDIDDILEKSYAENNIGEEVTQTPEVSEPKPEEPKPTEPLETTSNDPKPEDKGETKVVGVEETKPTEPEAVVNNPQPTGEPQKQVQNKRPFSRLEKAEFSAKKWKREAKSYRDKCETLQAQLEKYGNLDPRGFRNSQDAVEFQTWRANTINQLNAYKERIAELESEREQHLYDAKVSDLYDEEHAAHLDELDEAYKDALDYSCKELDQTGVVESILKSSRYEPAMREVIYKSADLQHQLFEVDYGSEANAAVERNRIMRQLEASIHAYFMKKNAPQAPNVEPTSATPVKPVEQKPASTVPQRRHYTLPSLAKAETKQPTKPSAPVTGPLTRGASASNGVVDENSLANEIFSDMYPGKQRWQR